MQSETLVEEFARLVREYKQDDGPGGVEAWNLIADFAVDNADAIEAALSAAEPVGEIAGQQGRYWMRAEGRWSNWFDITFNTWLPEQGVREVRNTYAAPPAPSVVVKALEWKDVRGDGSFAASTVFGLLYIASGKAWGFRNYPDQYPVEGGVAEAKAAAQADYEARIRSALTAQVQDVAGTVEAFDRDHPELYWHLAKGKITAGEPLYGAIITDIRGNELGDGESNISAIDAFNIAVDDAALPTAPAKQEGCE